MKRISVAAAVIFHNDEILCVQRGDHDMKEVAYKWEFPGGKVEKGESLEHAITREIKEELNMEVEAVRLLLRYEYHYPSLHLDFIVLKCKVNNRKLVLHEHIAYKWLKAYELKTLDWAGADLPAVKNLETVHGERGR